jgi:hypothetical protein
VGGPSNFKKLAFFEANVEFSNHLAALPAREPLGIAAIGFSALPP